MKFSTPSSSTLSLTRPLSRPVLPPRRLLASSPSPSPSSSPLPSSTSSTSGYSSYAQTAPRFIRHRSFFSLPDITRLAGLSVNAGPKDVSGVEVEGEEQRFHARKILPYTQAQLYTLIADVPSYSSFIPFCTASTVLGQLPGQAWKPDGEPFDVEAELRVGFGGLEERYISRVVGKPYESVTATASNRTPMFKNLVTTWSFSPASTLSPHPSSSDRPSSPLRLPNEPLPTSAATDGPTLLTIDLSFTFANPLHRIASQAVLPKVADKMVDAFENRCLEVWGPGGR